MELFRGAILASKLFYVIKCNINHVTHKISLFIGFLAGGRGPFCTFIKTIDPACVPINFVSIKKKIHFSHYHTGRTFVIYRDCKQIRLKCQKIQNHPYFYIAAPQHNPFNSVVANRCISVFSYDKPTAFSYMTSVCDTSI